MRPGRFSSCSCRNILMNSCTLSLSSSNSWMEGGTKLTGCFDLCSVGLMEKFRAHRRTTPGPRNFHSPCETAPHESFIFSEDRCETQLGKEGTKEVESSSYSCSVHQFRRGALQSLDVIARESEGNAGKIWGRCRRNGHAYQRETHPINTYVNTNDPLFSPYS